MFAAMHLLNIMFTAMHLLNVMFTAIHLLNLVLCTNSSLFITFRLKKYKNKINYFKQVTKLIQIKSKETIILEELRSMITSNVLR